MVSGVMVSGVMVSGVMVSGVEPRTTNHEPRTTNHEPRATNHEPYRLKFVFAMASINFNEIIIFVILTSI